MKIAGIDKTLTKGLSIIELLAEGKNPRGVSDISNALDMSKSNAHRLLQTLLALGYVKTSSGQYGLTPKICTLGASVVANYDVRSLAMAEMRNLADLTQETVHLSISDNQEVVYIEKIDSPQPVCSHTKIGGRAPAYCVSTGKALLAFQPIDWLEDTIKDLDQHTNKTITDINVLNEEFAHIRKKGYALNRGEWHSELGGVAAPIFDVNSDVVAAIGLSGPTSRLTSVVLKKYAPLICNAARAISVNMGAVLTKNGVPTRYHNT